MGDKCGTCQKNRSGRCQEDGRYVDKYDEACKDYEN